GAGQVFDVAQVQQQCAPARPIDQAEQLLADDVGVLFVQTRPGGEVDHGKVTLVPHLQAGVSGIRWHARKTSPLPAASTVFPAGGDRAPSAAPSTHTTELEAFVLL